MNTLRTIIATAMLATLGTACDTACDTDPGPQWSELRCWNTPGDPTCVGTLDGTTVRTIHPDVFDAALGEGRYEEGGYPTCDVGDVWDDVRCYTVTSLGATVCVGELSGVLVPTPDPCVTSGGVFVDLYGIPAWPDDPENYSEYQEIGWL